MKYKVLKDCILNHKLYKEGDTYTDPHRDGDKRYLEEAVVHGFLEMLPEKPKTVWDLETNDEYYRICMDGSILCDTWDDTSVDHECRDVSNAFLTEEEAEKEVARRKAKQILLKDTKGYQPIWDGATPNYEVYIDHNNNSLGARLYYDLSSHSDLWFANKEDAEASIKTHKREWKVYLGAGD